MTTVLQWQPTPQLLAKIALLAQQRGQAPERIITEAVEHYLQTQPPDPSPAINEPLTGLLSGSPDSSINQRKFQQDIVCASGLAWKLP